MEINIMEMLPLLIPIVIIELSLFAYVIYHIMTHDHYKRGNRILWLVIAIVFMNFVGPIAYLILGRED